MISCWTGPGCRRWVRCSTSVAAPVLVWLPLTPAVLVPPGPEHGLQVRGSRRTPATSGVTTRTLTVPPRRLLRASVRFGLRGIDDDLAFVFWGLEPRHRHGEAVGCQRGLAVVGVKGVAVAGVDALPLNVEIHREIQEAAVGAAVERDGAGGVAERSRVQPFVVDDVDTGENVTAGILEEFGFDRVAGRPELVTAIVSSASRTTSRSWTTSSTDKRSAPVFRRHEPTSTSRFRGGRRAGTVLPPRRR